MIDNQHIVQDLPAGLADASTEFIYHNEEPYAFNNGLKLNYESFPEPINDLTDRTIEARPKAVWALNDLGLVDPDLRRKQFIKCNLSAFDFIPDIPADLSRINTEYVPCSIRGACKYEGKLCQGVEAKNGTLTHRHLRIMSMIREGYFDKEICDKLSIKRDTLKSHKRKIQLLLGVERKSAIANVAATMQII